MKKLTGIRWLAIIVIVFSLIYWAYDSYFSLPEDNKKENSQEQTSEIGLFHVLLVGLDGRQGINDRADTLILASIDGKTEEVKLLSIPRDTRVKIKGGWDKVNAAYAYGGVDLTLKTISDFLDLEIERYAIVDFNSMVKIVDEIGGLDLDVPVRMYVPLEGIDLQPGKQHLNGEQVLAYSRYRGTANGDIDRAKRQQEVLKLLAQKVLRPSNLAAIPGLINIVKENVDTNLTAKEMIALARIAPDAMEKGIDSQVLPGKNKKIDGLWYWEPDLAQLDSLLSFPSEEKKIAVTEGQQET